MIDILKNSKSNSSNSIEQKSLLYLLDHYAKTITTKDLDKTIKESNELFMKLMKVENIIFFSLFNHKLDIHSYVNKKHIEEVAALINENFLYQLKEKKEVQSGNKYFYASYINKHMLGFLVFIDNNKSNLLPTLFKTHNEFISGLIEKEKTINDLVEHSQRSANIEENLNNTLSLVSHELRTPLANILGFSELMLSKSIRKEEAHRFLEEIFNAGQRLGGIIDNFLDFAKIKNGNLVENFTNVDLEDLCFKAWTHSVKPNDKVEIAWMVDTNLDEVSCDEAAISRVLTNLFTNAIKYSDKSITKIICQIKKLNDQEVLISIKDNGAGIDKEELSKIFDKFYRSQKASKNFISGSGLGLWICKEIIKAHGGDIECKSFKDQGTEFIIRLKNN